MEHPPGREFFRSPHGRGDLSLAVVSQGDGAVSAMPRRWPVGGEGEDLARLEEDTGGSAMGWSDGSGRTGLGATRSCQLRGHLRTCEM